MSSIPNKYPNFSDAEFRRCRPSCRIDQMDDKFMERLQTARTLAGVPFVINSAYRCVEYEKLMNRSGKSMHTLGRAVDIKCVDSGIRFRIISALLAAGFHGIGVDNQFIHVDDRDYPLVWLY